MVKQQTPRIAAIDAASMTPEQQAATEIVEAGPRGAVRGPFKILLNSPGAFNAAQGLGAYLRFESALPDKLRELAILITAHHWRQDYEWRIHSAIARDVGLSEGTIHSVASGAALAEASPEEAVIHAFCRQLHQRHDVDDATFLDAERLLGPAGIIDLCAVCGYYSLLAMVMNVARNPTSTGPLSSLTGD